MRSSLTDQSNNKKNYGLTKEAQFRTIYGSKKTAQTVSDVEETSNPIGRFSSPTWRASVTSLSSFYLLHEKAKREFKEFMKVTLKYFSLLNVI